MQFCPFGRVRSSPKWNGLSSRCVDGGNFDFKSMEYRVNSSDLPLLLPLCFLVSSQFTKRRTQDTCNINPSYLRLQSTLYLPSTYFPSLSRLDEFYENYWKWAFYCCYWLKCFSLRGRLGGWPNSVDVRLVDVLVTVTRFGYLWCYPITVKTLGCSEVWHRSRSA